MLLLDFTDLKVQKYNFKKHAYIIRVEHRARHALPSCNLSINGVHARPHNHSQGDPDTGVLSWRKDAPTAGK